MTRVKPKKKATAERGFGAFLELGCDKLCSGFYIILRAFAILVIVGAQTAPRPIPPAVRTRLRPRRRGGKFCWRFWGEENGMACLWQEPGPFPWGCCAGE